jgi:hypothetical protein
VLLELEVGPESALVGEGVADFAVVQWACLSADHTDPAGEERSCHLVNPVPVGRAYIVLARRKEPEARSFSIKNGNTPEKERWRGTYDRSRSPPGGSAPWLSAAAAAEGGEWAPSYKMVGIERIMCSFRFFYEQK